MGTVEEIHRPKLMQTIDANMEPLSSGYHWSEGKGKPKVERIKAEDEERKSIGTSNFELNSEFMQKLSTYPKRLFSSLCSLATGAIHNPFH